MVTVGKAVPPRGVDLAEAARLRDAVRGIVLESCGEPDLEVPITPAVSVNSVLVPPACLMVALHAGGETIGCVRES
jgi:hypothetical protein